MTHAVAHCVRRVGGWGCRRLGGYLFFLAVLVVVAPPVRAQQPADTVQTRTVFVGADSLIRDSETTRQLLGNVRVRQDSTLLFSDRGIEYFRPGEPSYAIAFVGRVLIVEKGDSLRADSVYYDRRTKIGRATGDVRLSDGEVEVLAPSGIYFVREKRARFTEGVRLRDSTATLTSRLGTYWSDDKRAELADSVRLHAEQSYLEADSLTYFRETEVSLARGDVFIERLGGDPDDPAAADSTRRTWLFGQQAFHDERAGLSRFEGRPLLVQIRQDSAGAEADTLALRARFLEALDTDSLQRLIAVDSVRIWQPDFAAVADSAVFERFRRPADSLATDSLDSLATAAPAADTTGAPRRDETRRDETRLFGHPIAWVGQAQITGDSLRTLGEGADLDSLFVRENAFIAQRDSALGRIQQVRGRHLVGVFLPDSVRHFTVGPNAEVLYFRSDDAGRLDGGLRTSGDRAEFTFIGDDLRRLFFPGAQGEYHDASILPEPFQLDGFRWMPERRPAWRALVPDARTLDRIERRLAAPPPEVAPPVSETAENEERRGF